MAAEQDRRSRMVISSVNATAPKGGAGGSYTWGAAMDVQDFEPVGYVQQGGYGVVTAPAMLGGTTTMMAPQAAFQMQQGAFPSLGGTVVQRPMVNSTWGPAPPNVNITASALRPGALEVIDSTHPRNMFAKKAYVRPAQEQMIDWSKAGVPDAVVKCITNAEAAHLSPYNQVVAAPVPLQTLRAQNVAGQASFQQYAPSIQQHIAGGRAPQLRTVSGGIQQPMKR